MYWHKSKHVLQPVNPSNAQRLLLSTVKTAYGAGGQTKSVMLQTVHTLSASNVDCCQEEYAEKA